MHFNLFFFSFFLTMIHMQETEASVCISHSCLTRGVKETMMLIAAILMMARTERREDMMMMLSIKDRTEVSASSTQETAKVHHKHHDHHPCLVYCCYFGRKDLSPN